MILLHSGFTRGKALAFSMLSSSAMIAGALLAYIGLSTMQSAVPVFLALAAASMIYVAVADLIPGLHKHPELSATVYQVLLIVAGIGTIWITHRLAESFIG
jgi:zinc and cadmium transporter